MPLKFRFRYIFPNFYVFFFMFKQFSLFLMKIPKYNSLNHIFLFLRKKFYIIFKRFTGGLTLWSYAHLNRNTRYTKMNLKISSKFLLLEQLKICNGRNYRTSITYFILTVGNVIIFVLNVLFVIAELHGK